MLKLVIFLLMHFPSSAGQNANGTVHKTDLDYLSQLLKDKKQLAAFPNVFTHVERLVDEGDKQGPFY